MFKYITILFCATILVQSKGSKTPEYYASLPAKQFTLIKTGMAAMKKGKYSSALKDFREPCEQDIGTACALIGEIYAKGLGTDVDTNKSIHYFHRACYGDFPDSCSSLGLQYEKIKDYSGQLKANKHGCDNQMGISCYILGLMYHKGMHAKKDEEKGIKYYKKACDAGYKKGCFTYSITRISTTINTKMQSNSLVFIKDKSCFIDGWDNDLGKGVDTSIDARSVIKNGKAESNITIAYGDNTKIPEEIQIAIDKNGTCIKKRYKTRDHMIPNGYKTTIKLTIDPQKIEILKSAYGEESPLYTWRAKREHKFVLYYTKGTKADKLIVITKDKKIHMIDLFFK